MTEKKILNCPLCGGKAFIYYSGSQFQFGEVVCKECGCRSDRKKVDETIELWNTRKPMERIVERLEEYRDDFMSDVYELFIEEPDNNNANHIIDMFDEVCEIVKEEGGLND